MATFNALRRPSLLLCPGILAVWAVTCGLPLASLAPAAPPEVAGSGGLLRGGDRVAWVGSSSTKIGVWPRTVEFLLRTRHPGLDLQFRRFTTGGGTFATGLEHLDEWLDDFRPTIVFFNYGGNDAAAGQEGLPRFLDTMERCVARARAQGARVVLITPQSADVRRSGAQAAARRTLYAETMLAYGRGRDWTVLDVHHPLDAMQTANQRDDPTYTILKDTIHLTDAAYVGWGFFLYDRLDLPFVRSAATLTADGDVTATENCAIRDVEAGPDVLSFARLDEVLPILPPGPLPPRLSVPLEAHSRYLLTITGLVPGEYEIRCDGRSIGAADAETLAVGVNLNSLLLDGDHEAPWGGLAQAVWDGRMPGGISRTRWRFEVRKL
jgi:lysophospholipase L1-like esterase